MEKLMDGISVSAFFRLSFISLICISILILISYYDYCSFIISLKLGNANPLSSTLFFKFILAS